MAKDGMRDYMAESGASKAQLARFDKFQKDKDVSSKAMLTAMNKGDNAAADKHAERAGRALDSMNAVGHEVIDAAESAAKKNPAKRK